MITKERLKLFNDMVKSLESHRDITINYGGEEIKTVFREYTDCTHDSATFIVDCSNDNRQYQLCCDFSKGRLYDVSTGDDVIVDDVFSARYLRGMLFAGQEALLRMSIGYGGTFIETFRRRNESKTGVKVPVFVSESQNVYFKRWLHVGNVSLSKGFVLMEGLMSSHSSDLVAGIPVKARCRVRLSDELVEWTYMRDGSEMKVIGYEFFHLPESTVSIRQILFAFTEYTINREGESDIPYPELTRSIREICNGESFDLMPKKPDWMGLYSPVEIYFRNIELLTSAEVVAGVCSSKSLETELVYERVSGKMFIYDRTGRGSKKVEVAMPNFPGVRECFKKALCLIEEYKL